MESDKDREGVEVLDSCSILNTENGLENHLPKHQHCACHLLNLVAIMDASQAEVSSKVFHGKHYTVKPAGLLSTLNLCKNNASCCSISQTTQDETEYSAAERMMRIMKEQGETSL